MSIVSAVGFILSSVFLLFVSRATAFCFIMSRHLDLSASLPTVLLPLASSLVEEYVFQYKSYLDSHQYAYMSIDKQHLFIYYSRFSVNLATAFVAWMNRWAHFSDCGSAFLLDSWLFLLVCSLVVVLKKCFMCFGLRRLQFAMQIFAVSDLEAVA